jgi:hypothetical protein
VLSAARSTLSHHSDLSPALQPVRHRGPICGTPLRRNQSLRARARAVRPELPARDTDASRSQYCSSGTSRRPQPSTRG